MTLWNVSGTSQRHHETFHGRNVRENVKNESTFLDLEGDDGTRYTPVTHSLKENPKRAILGASTALLFSWEGADMKRSQIHGFVITQSS
jgi:hypothetical protein